MSNFVKFPNSKVWRVDGQGWIQGTARVPDYESFETLEDRLDAIAEAATGSIIGLCDFSYQFKGNDLVSFHGRAEEYLRALDEDNESNSGYEMLDLESDVLKSALLAQFGLMPVEVEHALATLDTEYGEECVLALWGSAKEIRCPASPAECSYVRVVVDGLETAYWVEDEWRDDPATVMGAFLGAAKGLRRE